jgi:hypothetical protein
LLLFAALAATSCGQGGGASPTHATQLHDETDAARVHCPAPASIRSARIPTSFNAIYYAQTEEGVAFDGLDLTGLDPTSMSLVQAKVAGVGGVWRLYCNYHGAANGQHLSLASAGEARYQSCRFPDGSTSCANSLSSCVLLCPGQATEPQDGPRSVKPQVSSQEAILWLPDDGASAKPERLYALRAQDHSVAPGGARRPRIVWADDNADMRAYELDAVRRPPLTTARRRASPAAASRAAASTSYRPWRHPSAR